MSLGSGTTDFQINSVVDGQIVTKGSTVPLLINAQDASKEKDAEVEVTLTSAAGEVVAHYRSAASLNKQTNIALPPGLAAGLYRLDIVVYSGGESVQKKSMSFFVADDGWKIAGIASFPPLVTTKSSVMLKADLQVPAGANPWLRWSWKGKAIARGTLRNGYDQILWVAPSDEGVYTITLEMFPSSPAAGSDFPFTSTVALSSDVFVANGKAQAKGDLGPDSSYLVLLHLQGNLADSGTAARRSGITEAVPVGKPQIVSLDDGFGYRLDGSSGFQLPWLGLPVDGGTLKPFTLSIDVAFDDPAAAGTVVSALSADGSFSLTVTMDAARGGPRAVLSATGLPAFEIPWQAPALVRAKRALLSLSILPQGTTVTAQWFLDGIQVSAVSGPFAPSGLKQKGSLTVGGPGGFTGVVDELGVFAFDAAGRPSTDPDLYQRAQEALYGSNLVFADGFDGAYLSGDLSLEGPGQINAGTLSLKPGSTLGLPPVKLEGSSVTVTAALSPDSSRTVALHAQWEGDSAPAAQVSLSADADGARFRIARDGRSLVLISGTAERTVALQAPGTADARLLLSLGDPAAAATPLAIAEVLAVKERQ